jgi:hypothetical protein
MLFHINLLPPEKKEEVHKEMQARRLLLLCVGLVLVMSVFSAELFFVKEYISIQFVNLSDIVNAESSSSVNTKASGIEDNILKLNTAVQLNEHMLKDRMIVNAVLDAMAEALPEDVSLTRLTYTAEGKQIVFSGFSPTRAKFVLLINKLREYRSPGSDKEMFADFSSQVPYLSKQVDIKFDMSMKIRQ